MEAPVEKPMAVSGSGGSVARQPEKSVTPRKWAAAKVSWAGRGETTLISATPATRAGITVISMVEGNG